MDFKLLVLPVLLLVCICGASNPEKVKDAIVEVGNDSIEKVNDESEKVMVDVEPIEKEDEDEPIENEDEVEANENEDEKEEQDEDEVSDESEMLNSEDEDEEFSDEIDDEVSGKEKADAKPKAWFWRRRRTVTKVVNVDHYHNGDHHNED